MNNNQKDWIRIRSAVSEAAHGWLYDPNVMLIDYGLKERSGKLIEKQCIRVHVIEKIPSGLALEAATQAGRTRGPIPDTIAGIPVDIPQGVYALHMGWWSGWWPRPTTTTINPRARRHSPLQGGISISNARIRGYGTLGGQVIDRKTGEKMILSNWHVLAGLWQVRPGLPIYQPGLGDGGTSADTVARLSRHAMEVNLDAAVAVLTGNRQLTNDQFDLDPVKGVGWAQLGIEVIKSGRKTDITYGRVTGVEGMVKMSYNGVQRLIRNVITITPSRGAQVSAGGDSGSFWLEEDTLQAVGLHFAGSDHPERALAMDMHPILDALNVDIVV